MMTNKLSKETLSIDMGRHGKIVYRVIDKPEDALTSLFPENMGIRNKITVNFEGNGIFSKEQVREFIRLIDTELKPKPILTLIKGGKDDEHN